MGIVFGVSMSSYKRLVKKRKRKQQLNEGKKDARGLCMAALSTWFVFVGATSAV